MYGARSTERGVRSLVEFAAERHEDGVRRGRSIHQIVHDGDVCVQPDEGENVRLDQSVTGRNQQRARNQFLPRPAPRVGSGAFRWSRSSLPTASATAAVRCTSRTCHLLPPLLSPFAKPKPSSASCSIAAWPLSPSPFQSSTRLCRPPLRPSSSLHLHQPAVTLIPPAILPASPAHATQAVITNKACPLRNN